jgi:autotransporter passenger strand-loop-strand repeat protein
MFVSDGGQAIGATLNGGGALNVVSGATAVSALVALAFTHA